MNEASKEGQNKALAEQMKKHGIPFIIEKQGAFFTAWIPAESLFNEKIINKAAACLEALNRPVFSKEHKRLKRRRLAALRLQFETKWMRDFYKWLNDKD